MKKLRADQLLHDQGLVESRERARRLIMAGEVFLVRDAARERVDKPGRMLGADAELVVRAPERFVGRGGYKLLTAIEAFAINASNKVALDVGAATGGFTDCLLQCGAARVYTVDVGRGLLHERLRADPRVVAHEGVNIRYAPRDLLPELVDIVVADVSFISLSTALAPSLIFLKDTGEVVALIKPQFEVGKGKTVKGVVRDVAAQLAAVDKVVGYACEELGLRLVGVRPAQIKGPKGNQEYLAYLKKDARGLR